MASFVVTAEYVAINSVDMTAYVRSASLELSGDNVQFTNMASSGAHEYKLGLKGGTLNVEFNDDYASTTVDDRLWGIWNTGTNVTFEVRPTSAAVGASNPKYTGSVCPTGYTAVGGSVGDASVTSISWPTSGAVSRATST